MSAFYQDDINEGGPVLRRDEEEMRQLGESAIENNLEAMRDDMRDKGEADGEAMEAKIDSARTELQAELERNMRGDFSPPDIPQAETGLTDAEFSPSPIEQEVSTELSDADFSPDTDDAPALEDVPLEVVEADDAGEDDDIVEAGEADDLPDAPVSEDMPLEVAEADDAGENDEIDEAGETDDLPDAPVSEDMPLEVAEADDAGENDEIDEADEADDLPVLEDDPPETNDASAQAETAELIKNVVDQNVSALKLPKQGGRWAEAEGDSLWIPEDDRSFTWQKGGEKHTMTCGELKEKYGLEGVEYKNKEPDFEPFEDKTLGHAQLDAFPAQRLGGGGTYDMAARQIAQRLGKSEDWVRNYMQENNLTWHECADRRTVRAVPTEINAAFGHTGGIGVEKSLSGMARAIAQEHAGELKLERTAFSGQIPQINEMKSALKAKYRKAKR